MRFLFINQYYAPDFAATAQQLSDLCESLAEEGHDVHVLSSRAIYDGRDMQLPKYEVLNNVKVHRVSISNSKRTRLRDRFVGYLSFYYQSFIKVHQIPRPDVVVTLTTPPLISLLGFYLRTIKKARFICWVMDVYPDIAVKAEVLSSRGLLSFVWDTVSKFCYHTANRLVVLGHDMKKVMMDKGISEKKINIIQSWACSREVFPIPAEENEFRQNQLRTDAFNLMYSGNMGTCHAFKEAIKALIKLKDDSSIHTTFIGGGKQLPELKKNLEEFDNVTFLPYQDRDTLAQSISAPDAHLITLQGRFDGLLVPSKLYAIMAAARPVIFLGSHSNEVARIIKASNCGIVVSESDPQALIDAIQELSSNKDYSAELGENGRQYFLRHFDRKIAVKKFCKLLEAEAKIPGLRGERDLAHVAKHHASDFNQGELTLQDVQGDSRF